MSLPLHRLPRLLRLPQLDLMILSPLSARLYRSYQLLQLGLFVQLCQWLRLDLLSQPYQLHLLDL